MTSEHIDIPKGIECVPLPTPYPVGRVNCYVILGPPPCLIDVGVRSERSLDELREQLGEKKLKNLDSILLTHRHNDHSGAAPELSREGQFPVVCHGESLYDESRARALFLELIARYGAPQETLDQLRVAWTLSDEFGEPLEQSHELRVVADRERINVGGGALEVMSTPGHAPGHLCFVDREQGVIFCGDLLLAEITSNPLPHFDPTAPKGRRVSLALYLESLSKVEALGPLLGLPGHGSPLPDTAKAAGRAKRHILKRNEKVLRLIKKWPGASLFDLAGKFFFQEQNVLGQTLAFCELLAHTDLLEEHGRVSVDPDTRRLEAR